MSEAAKVIVELVANVERHPDLIYSTGAVWFGKGDRQDIDPEVALLMERYHPDVYKVVVATPKVAAEAAPPRPAALTAEDLTAMADDGVRAEARQRGYKLHPRLLPENLRSAFLDAQSVAAAA